MRSWLRRIGLWLALYFAAWCVGLLGYASQIPEQSSASDATTDAIVVLTGGKGRIERGVGLLLDHKASTLFISGVGEHFSLQSLEQMLPADIRKQVAALPAASIQFGHKAENTIGNASETKNWLRGLKPHNIHSILLVTSSYHMPRALREFFHLLPDMTIIPSPVFTDEFDRDHWLSDPASREMVLSEYNKYLAALLRHGLIMLEHKLR